LTAVFDIFENCQKKTGHLSEGLGNLAIGSNIF